VNNFWYSRTASDTVFVFIHGIFSDSRGCWLARSSEPTSAVFWLDLIRQDARFGNPSIYLAGFHTAIDAGDFSITQCAREIMDALERTDSDGAPPVLQWPRLVFVCHSTGGVIARYLLARHQSVFRDKAIGLALIASPSLGSVWANIASLAARYYNQRLGLQLRWGGASLEDIHDRFRELVDSRMISMPGLFGMEACENVMVFRTALPRFFRWLLPSRLKIVSTVSAGQYFGGVTVLRGTDHFSAVKPTHLDHPAHQFLATFYSRFSDFIATQERLRLLFPSDSRAGHTHAKHRPTVSADAPPSSSPYPPSEPLRPTATPLLLADSPQGVATREAPLSTLVLRSVRQLEAAALHRHVSRSRLANALVNQFPRGETDLIPVLDALCLSGDLQRHVLGSVSLTPKGRETLRSLTDDEAQSVLL
jgi:pimeloyl-ACP methyl ester carboxylesterase